MRMYDIILKKRANVPLTDEEIHFVIDGYVKGDIPDYQVSALLMTIVFNGMSARELGTLTLAMSWVRAYGRHYRQDGVHSQLKSIFRTR